jgi:hypothetical protein
MSDATVVALVAANQHQLASVRDLLARLDDRHYAAVPIAGAASVGAHLRHCLDACGCLLAGVAQGRVDYDARSRDRRVESDRHRATAVLVERMASLSALTAWPATTPLLVSVDAAEPCWTPSTLGRELQFLHGHTVHHLALVAALLRVQGVEPGAELGVAPSTLRHRAALTTAAGG